MILRIASRALIRILQLSLLLGSASAGAYSLNLTPQFPDLALFSGTLVYSYDQWCEHKSNGSVIQVAGSCSGNYNIPRPDLSSGVLTLNGNTLTLSPDGGPYLPVTDVNGGAFNYQLTATFSGYGIFQTGSVAAYGTTSNPTFQSGTLVTGTLYEMGFAGYNAAGSFEFRFNSIGGDMGANGAQDGGIIISTTSLVPTYSGLWDPLSDNNAAFWQQDFSATANANTYVPIPAAAWLLGSGLLSLWGARRIRIFKDV